MMILVDVYFPELDRTIDFQLDEDAQGWDIAEEIAAMAAQANGRTWSPNESSVFLYSVSGQRQLDLNQTLRSNGVQSGDRLLLI